MSLTRSHMPADGGQRREAKKERSVLRETKADRWEDRIRRDWIDDFATETDTGQSSVMSGASAQAMPVISTVQDVPEYTPDVPKPLYSQYMSAVNSRRLYTQAIEAANAAQAPIDTGENMGMQPVNAEPEDQDDLKTLKRLLADARAAVLREANNPAGDGRVTQETKMLYAQAQEAYNAAYRQAMQQQAQQVQQQYQAAQQQTEQGQATNAARGTSTYLSGIYDNADDRESSLYTSVYREIINEPDYAEFSQAGDSKVHWYNPFSDGLYNYINDINGAREKHNISLAAHDTRDNSWAKYAFMTADEIGTYNYIYATMGRIVANQFLKYLEPELDKQWYSGASRNATAWANQNVWTQALSSAATVMGRPARVISNTLAAGDDVARQLLGGKVNPYSSYRQAGLITNDIRDSVAEDITENYGEEWGEAYQDGMAAGDRWVDRKMLTGIASGLSAAADSADEGLVKDIYSFASRYIFKNLLRGYSPTEEDRELAEEALSEISNDPLLLLMTGEATKDEKSRLMEMVMEALSPVADTIVNSTEPVDLGALMGSVKGALQAQLWEYYQESVGPNLRQMIPENDVILNGLLDHVEENISENVQLPMLYAQEAARQAEEGSFSEENDRQFLPDGYNEDEFGGSEKRWEDEPFDEEGNLKPNIRYTTGEFDYIYETDELGRICHWETDALHKKKHTGRLPYDSNPPGKLPGDHAGHLAADQFGGSPELDNIVAMLASVNWGDYRRLENIWRRALDAQQQVSVSMDIVYEGDSKRPHEFVVKYWIDGKPFTKRIPNYVPKKEG